ncbi:hypothetical protein [Methanosarcina mazei]|jgi:hypothetical protein|uniref:hypothetical protein n=1 Tax=Methanosarcina mazei TaxID=2209 RepID=UPI0012D4BAC2|nr:hypothetical protein [Methanosarcina mazei]
MGSPRPEYSPCIKKDEFIRCQNILYIDRGFYKYVFTCAVRVLESKKNLEEEGYYGIQSGS